MMFRLYSKRAKIDVQTEEKYISTMADIRLFHTNKIRSVWNEDEEKWYFSVQDVVEVLIDSVDGKDYIKKMKNAMPG